MSPITLRPGFESATWRRFSHMGSLCDVNRCVNEHFTYIIGPSKPVSHASSHEWPPERTWTEPVFIAGLLFGLKHLSLQKKKKRARITVLNSIQEPTQGTLSIDLDPIQTSFLSSRIQLNWILLKCNNGDAIVDSKMVEFNSVASVNTAFGSLLPNK